LCERNRGGWCLSKCTEPVWVEYKQYDEVFRIIRKDGKEFDIKKDWVDTYVERHKNDTGRDKMKQKFIVETDNDQKISRHDIQEAIAKEIAPWNLNVREEQP
jgi:hypothetical protein